MQPKIRHSRETSRDFRNLHLILAFEGSIHVTRNAILKEGNNAYRTGKRSRLFSNDVSSNSVRFDRIRNLYVDDKRQFCVALCKSYFLKVSISL